MMVGREDILGWCLISGTALSTASGAQVGRGSRYGTCPAYQAVRTGYAGLGAACQGHGQSHAMASQLVLALERSFLDLD